MSRQKAEEAQGKSAELQRRGAGGGVAKVRQRQRREHSREPVARGVALLGAAPPYRRPSPCPLPLAALPARPAEPGGGADGAAGARAPLHRADGASRVRTDRAQRWRGRAPGPTRWRGFSRYNEHQQYKERAFRPHSLLRPEVGFPGFPATSLALPFLR